MITAFRLGNLYRLTCAAINAYRKSDGKYVPLNNSAGDLVLLVEISHMWSDLRLDFLYKDQVYYRYNSSIVTGGWIGGVHE